MQIPITYRNITACGALLASLALTGASLAQRHDSKPQQTHYFHRAERRAESPEEPKLLEWGYDQPTTADLRADLAKWEATPFDGVVLSAVGSDGKRKLDLTWNIWGHEAYTNAQFTQPVLDLRATHFQRFTDNFLRINVTPGDVDWFDDAGWKNICKNGALAALICQNGGLKGLMFDTEQYKEKIFTYSARPEHTRKSFEEYKNEARLRGKQFAEAITGTMPDITILFTYATAFRTTDRTSDKDALAGLLPAFIDGMLEGADHRARLVDACESAYAARDRSRLTGLREQMRSAKRLSVHPDEYASRMHMGYGLWLDTDWQHKGWDANDTAKNFYQPEEFQTLVRDAVALTDKYVWVYSEKIRWPKNIGMSEKYAEAIKNGRIEGLRLRRAAKGDTNPFRGH